jgi:hypothetical protein
MQQILIQTINPEVCVIESITALCKTALVYILVGVLSVCWIILWNWGCGNNGSSVVILDREARSVSNPSSGFIREPLLRLTFLWMAIYATNLYHVTDTIPSYRYKARKDIMTTTANLTKVASFGKRHPFSNLTFNILLHSFTSMQHTLRKNLRLLITMLTKGQNQHGYFRTFRKGNLQTRKSTNKD